MIKLDFKEWVELNEVFNSPLPIKWKLTTPEDWEGVFFVPDINFPKKGRQYIINMMKEPHMPWEIKFEMVMGKTRTQEITGSGNAAQVFSTVLNGIQQFLNKVKPDSFALSAREPSRQSLYRRLLGMLPRKMWDIEDLGSTFFVQNKTMKPVYAGYRDDDFDDYNDDDDYR